MTGKFSIDTTENYVSCVEEHVIRDEVTTEKEKEKLVRQLNGHSAILARALGLYTSHFLPDDETPFCHTSRCQHDATSHEWAKERPQSSREGTRKHRTTIKTCLSCLNCTQQYTVINTICHHQSSSGGSREQGHCIQ